MLLGIGPLTTQFDPDRQPDGWTTVWADTLALARLADELGFDSVWVGEHHFTEDGYLAAAFPLLAAMAAQTTGVLLGTKVLLAPLHHPVRVAEDAAAVHGISGGRLALGLGIGYREEEFTGLGLSLRDRARRMEQLVSLCRAAWSGAEVTPPRAPSAVRIGAATGAIPLYLGGTAHAALDRAGRIGDGYVAPIAEAGLVRELYATVAAAATEHGRPSPALVTGSHVLLRHPGLDAREQDMGLASLVRSYNGYRTDADAASTHTTTVEGSPRSVVRQLLAFADITPPSVPHHHVVRLEYPGMPVEQAAAALRLFATEVLPALRRGSK